ncbi:hypothetical protein NDU88_006896 [Pleurodeles waltl]|uniref:Uncharacterized protein n=1 Tax=Pleurodeles waltl TaxID=8319 RepID=A0AAV7NZF3_PLEWA|nr:hypothetical protein NDU88_006896 [Pleurodeles waltl]
MESKTTAQRVLEMAGPVPITQNYMNHFLKEIGSGITSLKDDLKSCIRDVQKEMPEVGGRVDDLECTVDAQAEDQEMLWRLIVTLEEQQIELHLKQDNLENGSHQNNVRIRGVPRDEEGADIIAYTAGLLRAVGGDPCGHCCYLIWPIRWRWHQGAPVPHRTSWP